MPQAYRHRAAGAAVGAAVAAAVALLPAAAAAAATPSVTFTGSCGVLGILAASSTPDRRSLEVPAGSAVVFVNRLSRPAQLRLDGQPAGTVARDGSVTKVFQRGTVAVTLVPDCLLDNLAAVKEVAVSVGSGPEPGAGQPPGRSAQPGPPAPGQAPAGAGPGPAGAQRRNGVPQAGAQPVPSLAVPGDALPPNAGASGSPAPAVARLALPGPAGRHGASPALVAVAAGSIVVASIAAIRAILAKRAARAVGA